MSKCHLFKEETKKMLLGGTVTEVGDDYICIDGQHIYIDDNNEIENLNRCANSERFEKLAELLLQMIIEGQEFDDLGDDFKMPPRAIEKTAEELYEAYLKGDIKEDKDGGLYYSGMTEDFGEHFHNEIEHYREMVKIQNEPVSIKEVDLEHDPVIKELYSVTVEDKVFKIENNGWYFIQRKDGTFEFLYEMNRYEGKSFSEILLIIAKCRAY